MADLACEVLGFEAVDDLTMAVSRDRLPQKASKRFLAGPLGPLLEMAHFAEAAGISALDRNPWIDLQSHRSFCQALYRGDKLWHSRDKNCGFCRIAHIDADLWIDFQMETQRAAQGAGFQRLTAAGLVGAVGEMESNIREHSGATETGLVAYRSSLGQFEFVIADHGMGVLNSLKRHGKFAELQDDRKAIEIALQDGVSSSPEPGRGHGFRQLFVGLANLMGTLRFRSGNQALTIDGRSPQQVMARTAQKSAIGGFFISVLCSP